MSESDISTSTLRLAIVTPEDTVLDTHADFVALPLFDGELGVAFNHSPMIGRLRSGEVRMRSGSETAYYYVEGGFVQVANNEVSIMTNHAQPAADIDAESAQKNLEESLKSKAFGERQMAARSQQVDQSRAKVRIARRVSGS